MFRLSTEKIESPLLSNPAAGAFVCFEGCVRNHCDGRGVVRLEYEAFEPLAFSEGERILQEAKERFDILDAEAIHRVGNLAVGETAVWVGVAAAHREAAFLACRYIIDEIKTRLPIWKKEAYADGNAAWVSCHHSTEPEQTDAALSSEELAYYSRQILLPEVGIQGQLTLKKAKILVVGSGGLGSPVLMYLARAGLGTLGICEFDRVSADNLPRQVLYKASDIGILKALRAQESLKQINPHVQVRCHMEPLTPNNAQDLCSQYDLVLDCTDNRETHLLLSRMAVQTQKTLIQAGVYRYEGQLAMYRPDGKSPCLCGLWESPEQSEGTCAIEGILNTVPGVFGLLQTTEAIKALLGLHSPLGEHLLLFDLLEYQLLQIRRTQKHCATCLEKLIKQPTQKTEERNSSVVFAMSLDDLQQYSMVCMGPIKEVDLPISDLWDYWDHAWRPESQEQKYLLVCPFGKRSLQVAIQLRKKGFSNVYSLHGGLPVLQGLATAEVLV